MATTLATDVAGEATNPFLFYGALSVVASILDCVCVCVCVCMCVCGYVNGAAILVGGGRESSRSSFRQQSQ